jgi:hypothetical protein
LTSTTLNMYAGELEGAGALAAQVLGELLPAPKVEGEAGGPHSPSALYKSRASGI